MAEIKGFEVPIHTSLTSKILIMGVPREIAILNGMIAAAFGLGLQSFYILPINLVVHIFCVAATKKDPQFFDVFLRHIRHKKHYEV